MSKHPAPTIPSAEEIKDRLQPLGASQLRRLAELSGVSLPTLLKIRYGKPHGTDNPGIDTVRKFAHHIEAAKATQ